jgi:hypothetical protein
MQHTAAVVTCDNNVHEIQNTILTTIISSVDGIVLLLVVSICRQLAGGAMQLLRHIRPNHMYVEMLLWQ